MTTVFAGDVGTKIILDCGVDISLSSARSIIVRKPSGLSTTWVSVLEGTNSIQYTTLAGDLDEVGRWKLQAYIEMPSWKGSGEVVMLVINRPLFDGGSGSVAPTWNSPVFWLSSTPWG